MTLTVGSDVEAGLDSAGQHPHQRNCGILPLSALVHRYHLQLVVVQLFQGTVCHLFELSVRCHELRLIVVALLAPVRGSLGLPPDVISKEVVTIPLGGRLSGLALLHQHFRVRQFLTNCNVLPVSGVFRKTFLEHGRSHEEVSSQTYGGEGVLVEADPDKAQILDRSQDVFLASEKRSVRISPTNCHIAGLLVDFFKKSLFELLHTEGAIDSLHISRQNVIKFIVKAHFAEILIDFLLTDPLVRKNRLGVELKDSERICSHTNDLFGLVLVEGQRFMDEGVLRNGMDERGSGCQVDSLQTAAEQSVNVGQEGVVALFSVFIFDLAEIVVDGDVVLVRGEVVDSQMRAETEVIDGRR
jgi:hypothetical protein